eukprot:13832093-Alexandrium_andersonii.AAC.1
MCIRDRCTGRQLGKPSLMSVSGTAQFKFRTSKASVHVPIRSEHLDEHIGGWSKCSSSPSRARKQSRA